MNIDRTRKAPRRPRRRAVMAGDPAPVEQKPAKKAAPKKAATKKAAPKKAAESEASDD